MIQLVAHALPTYHISCFKVPNFFFMSLLYLLVSLGGVEMITRTKFIKRVMKAYVFQSLMETLVLRILKFSTWPFL